jgi:hypothetical protein
MTMAWTMPSKENWVIAQATAQSQHETLTLFALAAIAFLAVSGFALWYAMNVKKATLATVKAEQEIARKAEARILRELTPAVRRQVRRRILNDTRKEVLLKRAEAEVREEEQVARKALGATTPKAEPPRQVGTTTGFAPSGPTIDDGPVDRQTE